MPDSIVEYTVNRKVAPVESFTVTLSPSAVLNIVDALSGANSLPIHSVEWKQFTAMRKEIKWEQSIAMRKEINRSSEVDFE